MSSTSLEDPLHSYAYLSVFPRAFSDAPKSSTDVSVHDDYLKSIVLRSPSRYLEQAKAILDKCPETLNSSNLVLEENHEDDAVIQDNRQERRPGLGRKRAKFTFKLKESEPTVNLEPILDFSKLKDPEDFFLAYAAMENDKKGKKNESGISEGLDTNLDNLSMPSRPRRRGLLGRKASYKHRYPSAVSDDIFPSSQEMTEESSQRISKDAGHSENDDPNIVLQDGELDGKIAEKEDKVNKLLDELLSGPFSDPDDDDHLKSLQERLQYKPLGKLSLPDIPDIPTYDLDVFGGNLPLSRHSISDRHMNVKEPTSNRPSPSGRDTEISSKFISSPTPPKSPFASVSLLQRQILQSASLQDHDPFSPRNIDLSPAKGHSPVKNLHMQTDKVDQPRDLGGDLESLVHDEQNGETSKFGSSEGTGKDRPHSFDQFMDDGTPLSKDISPEKNHSPVEELHEQYNGVENQGELSGKSKLLVHGKDSVTTSSLGSPDAAVEDQSCLVDKFIDDNASTHDSGNNDNSVGSLDTLEENITGNEKAERIRADNQSERHETFSSAQSDADMDIPVVAGQSTSLTQTTSSMALIDGKEPQTRVDQPEQQIEINQHSRSCKRLGKRSRKDRSVGEAVRGKKESSKAVQHGEVQKKKSRSMRQSLAGAGTYVESGVRRSSRIKSKPLEYWRGERFIYARVHQSLPTIIGMKYFSPGKSVGKQTDISVKAFVSDEYKELLERAARY